MNSSTASATAPHVSVVITAYNYGRFIEEAIHSVLSQDYPGDRIEVVVADDGSTDDTAERVKKYDSRVKYFYQLNRGQAAALNLGFANASGEIVALLDGDDFFLPGKLARVAEAFQRDPTLGMVYHPMMGWDVQTNERRLTQFPLISGSPSDDIEKFWGYSGPGTCVSYRRKFLDRLLPIPEEIRMLADAFPGGLIVFVAPILALPECFSVYRVHGKNSYQVDESKMAMGAKKRRFELDRIVVHAMKRWLADQGYMRRHPFAQRFCDYWDLHLDQTGFLFEPPGRLRFFWYLVKENNAYRPRQSWKLTTINYLACPLALIFGYKRAQSMYKWRGRLMRAAERLFRKFFGGQQGPKITARTEDV